MAIDEADLKPGALVLSPIGRIYEMIGPATGHNMIELEDCSLNTRCSYSRNYVLQSMTLQRPADPTACVLCRRPIRECAHPWHLPFAHWPAKPLFELRNHLGV